MELTDASFGSTDMYDAAWQGHSGEWPLRTAVVDLGQICAVEQVSMNFLAKKRLRHLPALALFCVCFLRRTHLGRAV